MKIHAKAPTRIDLAGGTIDLWPLYLFLDHPTTLNLAIDLYAEAHLEEEDLPTPSPWVTLTSLDQGQQLRFSWKDLLSQQIPPSLLLHHKLLSFIAVQHGISPRGNLSIQTKAGSPAGAGLGGSSTLSVALVGAITAWARGGNQADVLREGEALVDVVRDIETTVIQVPAGIQDYYGAMFGGLQSLRWGVGRHTRQWLDPSLLNELESRIALFYSGHSRNSGIHNWSLFKSFIDQEENVRERFDQINQAARDLESALKRQDWSEAGRAIAEEWESRRTLAQGISTPEIDQAFLTTRRAGLSSAGKICGAGGGGCFFIYVTDPGKKEAVEKTLAAQGHRLLPFRASQAGLEVSGS